ncbi:hypothetical protein G6V44_000936 [Neisseria gonorrhoeae]|uniref:Putative phage associated protein n=10 Tax=Neisseria gonorrhoeae TaxID=485 RepID=A0A1D3IGZ2_NEIGO|nr:hypothetical protein [Neisseria gonorrhoeae]ACF30086.1 putative phage associated protein [Neisseria gonorrhoeae NCCP11945]AKP13117.1 hypothetical protein WX60_01219 [Neisseria gonorrhoeae]AKP14789.1 hypothetical protein WX61_00716 [Neisseria gonorrhoeae]ANJ47993.1 hypothetical protein ASO12_05960 [Neisseria gonorrhoeae]ANJ50267.1 hypothetical protein A9Y60_06480 [Neisseria gonorrhoeae]
MNGLIKNPKLIAVSVCAVFVAGAWQYDRAAQYRRGYGAAMLEVSERLKAAAVEHAEHARKSSAAYQAQKAAREEKERVRYVQTLKIIEKPVYRNACFDADGVRELNAAVDDGG